MITPKEARRITRAMLDISACIEHGDAPRAQVIITDVIRAYAGYIHAPQATFTPSSPQPALGEFVAEPLAELPKMVPAPVPTCAQCGDALYRPEVTDFPTVDGWAHTNPSKDDHAVIVSSRAPETEAAQ